MNYFRNKEKSNLIQEQDICVIHISENLRFILRIEPDAQLQTKFGIIRGPELIGHQYGVSYNLKKGWVLPLRLTPELWTQLLSHRTQILYQTDISLILLQLDIKPGSVVVESGTGSGSLSHSILRACAPNGFLYTFDTNESRVSEARREFEEHGYSSNVRVECRNICQLGYGEDLFDKADACILDLPQTWDAIEHAYRVLKSDGARLCTFSPCIEQVKQNVAKMTELKFKDIVTLECLLRPFKVQQRDLRVWDADILESLSQMDRKRIDNIEAHFNDLSRQSKLSNDDQSTKPTYVPKIRPTLPDNPQDQLRLALSDPKIAFNPTMLPLQSHFEARHLSENVSHSGYLTFATKRL